MYYISKPLVGLLEQPSAPKAKPRNGASRDVQEATRHGEDRVSSPSSVGPKKKSISSFKDLMVEFPMIARHMQSGLEKILKDFQADVTDHGSGSHDTAELQRRRRLSASSVSNSVNSRGSHDSNGRIKAPSVTTLRVDDEEQGMRYNVERAVNAAVELFQQVDKQQLSHLGTTTNLTGSAVERLIEQYILEHFHDVLLFPLLCKSRSQEDKQLEILMRQMEYIDVAQVGIAIEHGLPGKNNIVERLEHGVLEFRKLGVAGSPYQMMEILLSTQMLIANASQDSSEGTGEVQSQAGNDSSVSNMNADTLVSLLLVVVIRAQVRHLYARLAYMRNFIFGDDVESGERGYALSTLEAVLTYLFNDEGGLRKASKQNRRLWQAVEEGNFDEVKSLLEPSNDRRELVQNSAMIDGPVEDNAPPQPQHEYQSEDRQGKLFRKDSHTERPGFLIAGSNLAHVFPFQSIVNESLPPVAEEKPKKRVSMNLRRLSISSDKSWHSRSTTLASLMSANSAIEGDISAATLAQTQNAQGKSVLMLAIESRRAQVLEYLLGLEDFYTIRNIFDDSDYEGTTLLSAAIQTGQEHAINALLHRIAAVSDRATMVSYLSTADKRGRTAAHYLFNAPKLILRLGHLVPWRQKDKNGQTPLLALCRSYDHPQYLHMVDDALYFATREQNDRQPLHLNNHIDAKGNTPLHVVNDPNLAVHMLRHCDCDPNNPNLKGFTPLMTASKFGRLDMVRAFFGDSRVDIQARDIRGMTAVEVAKDDEVRNRIDDMILVSNVPGPDGRVTAIVRAFLAEEDSIQLIIKSAVRNDNGMISVTTCRRSLTDFENLARWLSGENPASWLPSVFNFRSPFQIPSKPSRAALSDIQVRLDRFLKIMMAHSTFSTHPLLYEFVLFPEIQSEMMADRSRRRIEIRPDNIREEYEPVTDMRSVESFVAYARDSVRGVDQNLKALVRNVANIRNLTQDQHTAFHLLSKSLSGLDVLPQGPHLQSFIRLVPCYQPQESEPHRLLLTDLLALTSTTVAILSSLSRPHQLIAHLHTIQRNVDRQASSLRRSDRWLPVSVSLLEDTRKNLQADAFSKAKKLADELRQTGCELSYTHQTVARELAEWQELHAKLGRRAIRDLGKRTLIRERDRLEQMKGAVREVVRAKEMREA